MINDPMISISTQAASLGYFSSLTVDELKISSTGQAVDIRIEKIRAEKSWLAMLAELPQLGAITFTHPALQIMIDPGRQQSPSQPTAEVVTLLPVFTAIVERGEIRIQRAQRPRSSIGAERCQSERQHAAGKWALGVHGESNHRA